MWRYSGGDFNDSSELLKWSSNSFKWRLGKCHICHICHPFSPQSSPDPSFGFQCSLAVHQQVTCWVALGNAQQPLLSAANVGHFLKETTQLPCQAATANLRFLAFWSWVSASLCLKKTVWRWKIHGFCHRELGFNQITINYNAIK